MTQRNLTSIWKAFLIGATMIVPGVSGGTMAMILGIYDRLISAVSSFRKHPRDNFLFLILFTIFAGLGVFLFSTPVSWLLEHYEIPTLYFFIGAVAGGIPLIEQKSGMKKVDFVTVLYLLAGALVVVLISKFPQDFIGHMKIDGISHWPKLGIAGMVLAVALILPGVSFSHFLLILGLYEKTLTAVKILDFSFLIPLAIGVFLGIVIFSKLLEFVLGKYPKGSYLLILGFIIGSVAMIFPGVPKGGEIVLSTITAPIGFWLIYHNISLAEKNNS